MKSGGEFFPSLWVACLMAGSVAAAEPPAPFTQPIVSMEEGSIKSSREMLESKTRLIKLLLAQSPALQRIPSSSNVQAKKQLDDVQSLYARAGAEDNAGQVASAIKLLDEALHLIVVTSRLVPDPAQIKAQERARYIQLSEAVQTFQTLHQNVVGAASENKGQLVLIAEEMKQIKLLFGKAEVLAAQNNYSEANALMSGAYNAVVSALNKMLSEKTIVYDLKFPTPAAEYQHEITRYHSYEELIPIALVQLNPAPETAKLTERYVSHSHDLLAAAKRQADHGEYQVALKTLQEAISHLQRSLRIAGVVVPQTPEN
jgi:hypothetical protein